jgi:hypothetical protein
MLSERERQILHQMEMGLSFTDPRFVAAMRTGRPRPPREYRRTLFALLLVLGLASFVAVVVTGHPLALLALLATSITGLCRFVFRELDQP